jgi:hypothetical protein
MKISDEIRELAGEAGIYSNACVKLRELADRIDREMVELPKDADGVPIHIGDTVYTPKGSKADVESIELKQDENSVVFIVRGKGFFHSHLSHTRLDTFERIAGDIEAAEDWCDKNGEYGTGITSVSESTLREWADRIRKLAKKEDE